MVHSSDDTIKEIKRSFRSLMNGVTSQSMRSKGVDYHLNWGIQLPQLQQMAQTGQLTQQTYVWKPGMANWEFAGNVPELTSLFNIGTPPPPPSPNV